MRLHAPLACLLLPLMSLLSAPSARAQPADAPPDSRQEVAQQVRQLVQQVQSVRDDRRRAQRAHRDRLATLERQIERLEGELNRLDQPLAEQARAIERETAARDRAREQQARLDQLLGQVRRASEPIVRQMRERVDRGIAFERDQRGRGIDRAAKQLAADQPAAWADAWQAVFGFATDELEAGRTIDLINQPIHLDAGRRREHAWVLRLGLAGALFVTEDESLVGEAATPSSPEPWRTTLPPRTRAAAVRAVRIRRDSAAPALVDLPYLILEPTTPQTQEAAH